MIEHYLYYYQDMVNPQLHSNLKFVQLFRRETKLIWEVEYYQTNLISAKMFIIDINARSLSIEEIEFQKHMESARLSTQTSVASPSSSQGLPTSTRANQEETDTDRFPYYISQFIRRSLFNHGFAFQFSTNKFFLCHETKCIMIYYVLVQV